MTVIVKSDAGSFKHMIMNLMPDRDGRTVLHYAAMENDVSTLLMHINSGADLNLQDRRGYTPLHFAAQEYAIEAARLLLDHGAVVDATDIHGNTPLWTAVFNSKGRGEIIIMFRIHGADPYKANRYGKTPLELASTIANYDIAQFFANLPQV